MINNNNSGRKCQQLLFRCWELNDRKYQVDTTINWRGNELRVKIRSSSAVICTCINYDIWFNEHHYSYHILYSNGTATKLKIPDIYFENYRLEFGALPTSLEILEVPIKRMLNHGVTEKEHQESGELRSPSPENEIINNTDYLIPQRPIDSWILVTRDLMTEKVEIPFTDSNLLLWIGKSKSHQYDSSTWLYKYELFTHELQPMQFMEGNFTCIGISDCCQNIGCGTHRTIQFKISDCNDIVRSFNGFALMENGVIEAIEFMRTLNGFIDWNDYDTIMKLTKLLDITVEELDKLVTDELESLGMSGSCDWEN